MRKEFNTFEYVDDLGKDLIRDFEKAGKTTHPHSVGEGREKSTINKLKDIMPKGIGIGSGFVIDSFGNVSSQCDIVIYEKDLCLLFNSYDEKNCYYNCESVIAVGEVKSSLDRKELEDCLQKLNKIKNLKRKVGNERNFRNYLSKITAYGSESESYDQKNKASDQIFTFIICNSFSIKYTKIIEIINENKNIYEYPNSIVSIDGGVIGYAKQNGDGTLSNVIGSLAGELFTYGIVNYPFGLLLEKLFIMFEQGRSVRYNPSIYILKPQVYDVEMFRIINKNDCI